MAPIAPQPVDEAALRRRGAVGERHRLDEAERAEADVGEPHLAVERHAQHHVRAAPAVRRAAPHTAEERVGGNPELAQGRREQRVVLEAVAAAPLVEELALEIAEREADAPAGLNRQVLEEERLAVRAVQAPERVGVRLRRRVLSNPRQVLVDPHLTRHHSW